MLINNTIIALTATATAYKINNHRNEAEVIKAEMLDEIIRQLNEIRTSSYSGSYFDYSSSSSSDDSSMSSEDYELFYGSFEPVMFN